MSYIGSTPTTQSFISGTDYFNGTGSQTAFTLSRTVNSVNDIEVVINNVVQQPNTAYTLSGTTITFTSAPSSGSNNIYVRYLSTTTQSITPSQGTVSYSTFNSDNQSKLGIMYKNRIINGAMLVDQRNAGASVSISNNAVTYTVDRWLVYSNNDGFCSMQQVSDAPAGFTKSLKFTTTTADSSLSSTQRAIIQQRIEGLNATDLGWGTVDAKTITLSFWVKSSLTGTFGGALQNETVDRAYPFSYTISASNTWEQKTITVVGDATGTWPTNNTSWCRVCFGLGVGSTYSGTAGAWVASDLNTVTGAVSVIGTLNATWQLTGVQFEVGTQATTFTNAGGSYGGELALCQRYYETSYEGVKVPTNIQGPGAVYCTVGTNTYGGGVNTNQQILGPFFFKVTKRAAPSLSIYSYTSSSLTTVSNGWTGADLAANSGTTNTATTSQFSVYNSTGSNITTGGYAVLFHFAASAEL